MMCGLLPTYSSDQQPLASSTGEGSGRDPHSYIRVSQLVTFSSHHHCHLRNHANDDTCCRDFCALPSMVMDFPTQIHGHTILQACQLELDALSYAISLHKVIEQVEEGHVQQIQDKLWSPKWLLT